MGPVSRSSIALWVALAALGLSRLAIALHGYPAHSTMSRNLEYGFGSLEARRQGVSLYDVLAERALEKRRQDPDRDPELRDPAEGTAEYPPLAVSWMTLPVRLLGLSGQGFPRPARDAMLFIRVSRSLLAAADLVAFGLLGVFVALQRKAPRRVWVVAVVSYAACGAFFSPLIYDRMDIVVGALLIAAAVLLVSRFHYVFSFALLALAINFKLVAILAAPVWLVGSLPCGVWQGVRQPIPALLRRTAVLAALTGALFLPYWIADGPRSLGFLQYHLERGVQIESHPANAILLLRPFGLSLKAQYSHGSINLVTPVAFACAVAFALAGAGCFLWAVLRLWQSAGRTAAGADAAVTVARRDLGLVVRYAVLLLVIGLCGSKVLSPQYLLWLLPLAPAVPWNGRGGLWFQVMFAAACGLTMLIYPVLYDQISPIVGLPGGMRGMGLPSAAGTLAITARNATLIGLAALLWRNTAEAATTSRPATARGW
ncbi:MAG: hypothetical protein ACE141_07415 [Bryobacteraceae bacterium]